MQNNKYQTNAKSLKNRDSTFTKHSEAYNISGDYQLRNTDQKESFQLQELKYNPLPNFPPSGFGVINPSFIFASNPYPQQTMAEQFLIQFNPQSTMFQSLPLKHLAAEGMRIVCEIDIIMLKYYYPLREQIFNKHNQSAMKRMDNNANHIEWIKGRFQYRFKDKISRMMCKLVDEVRILLSNKREDDQQPIEKLQFEPTELLQLDKELQDIKEPHEQLNPQEVLRRISKLIEMYFKGQDQQI